MQITRSPFDDSDAEEGLVGTRYDYLDDGYGLWARTYDFEPRELSIVALTRPLRGFDSIPYDDPRFARAVRALLRESGAADATILVPGLQARPYAAVDLLRLTDTD